MWPGGEVIMNWKTIIFPEETEVFGISIQVRVLPVPTWAQTHRSHTKTYPSCDTSVIPQFKQQATKEH